MEKNIPINKGNYEMDTEERSRLFEANRAYGWEKEYKEYRRHRVEYPKSQYVAEYPLLVDIELSALCNLKCPMCYTITEEFKSKVSRKFMEWDLFQKIVDEIAGKVPAVRLSLRGEATLHPDFVKCIRYCKKKGIGEVSFLTNGSKLEPDFFIEIAEAGADWITVSIDGLNEQYEQIRSPLKFKDTLDKLKQIKAIKESRGWKRPVIKVQSIWPAIRSNPSEFYNTLAPYVDLIAFNPLIDLLGNDSEDDILYEKDFSCSQFYQRLVIGADGKVFVCANDEDGKCVIGNVMEQSVYELWHSEQLNEIRELHKQGAFKQIEICRRCYVPRMTEESEHANVNGREIIIKNYVNRNQVIGK